MLLSVLNAPSALMAKRAMPRRRFAAAIAGAAFAAFGLATPAAPQPDDGPPLPAQIRDQLEIDSLQREIRIINLQQELARLQGPQDSELERKIKQLGDMRQLLEINAEVRMLVQEAPELDNQYWRILEVDSPPPACRCLEGARVHWLGRGEQAGQAVIRLDGEMVEAQVGEAIGGGNCRLAEADERRAVLTCGGRRKVHALYSPVRATPR